MRKILIAFALLLLLAGVALADTLYLRNGKVVKGTFIGFEGSQFIFETGNGEQTKHSVWQVSRVVLDRGTDADDDTPYRRSQRRDRDISPTARWETTPAFDVRLQDQWIRSRVQVRKGQRVRVEATGTVTLEGRYNVSPDGQGNLRTSSLPMPNQNAGALIAVIGRNEDAPLMLIGRQREFIADRDGVLFFSVNHWETRNAGGAFRVTVSIDRSTGRGFAGSSGAAQKREKVITIPGNAAWIDTGVDLNEDAALEIAAEGRITFRKNQLVGPDGDIAQNRSDVKFPINGAGVGALIAKIRYSNGTESGPRLIGARYVKRFGSSEYGRLFLGINDSTFGDNTGSYTVTIRW